MTITAQLVGHAGKGLQDVVSDCISVPCLPYKRCIGAMPVSSPTWIYVGNSSTLFNANWASPIDANADTTPAEAGAVTGQTFSSSDMMGVTVTGNATGFGGVNFTRGEDVFSYSLDDGLTVKTAVYTGHIVFDMTVMTVNPETHVETPVILRGILIQMENGDYFVRPFYTDVDLWNAALGDPDTQIFSITLDSIAGDLAPGINTDASSDGLNASATFDPNLFTPSPFVPCFTAGTLIATSRGKVAVEDLRVGDLVVTRDSGLQPIRWIGGKRLNAATLTAQSQLRPIRIVAGALGDGTPTTDLLVSPQHRVLVRSKIAQRMFGATEVLVAAKQLLLIDGISIAEDLQEVEYVHFLFDDHQVVISNGAETESLYTGPEVLKSLRSDALEEIFAIFPDLRNRTSSISRSARMQLNGHQGRKLAQRHAKNRQPMVMFRNTDAAAAICIR